MNGLVGEQPVVEGFISRQPKSLWVLSIIFSMFMWGFANIISSLTLYLTSHNYSVKQAYDLYGSFAALIWVMPMVGGCLAQYFGYRFSTYVGLICVAFGMLFLWLPVSHDIRYALALFLVGSGFVIPSVWCLVDHLYSKDGENRRIGFTFFYIIFNLGGALGIFLGGYLVILEPNSNLNFCANFIMSILSLSLLLIMRNSINYEMVRDLSTSVRWTLVQRIVLIIISVIASSLVLFWMMLNPQYSELFLWVCFVVGCGLLIRLAIKNTGIMRKRIVGYAFVSLASFLFWILYNLEPSLLSVFGDKYVNRQINGIVIPATVFFGFACIFAIIVGLLLNKIWIAYARMHKKIGMLLRIALGVLAVGAGYLYLTWIITASHEHIVSAYLFVVSYALFAFGEMLISPLGISMSGELSPQGQEGLFMGFWQMVVGLSAIISSHLADLTVNSSAQNVVTALHGYRNFFMCIGVISALSALLLYAISRRFDRWLLSFIL
jgi:POT family proton-dependent oligopeptide transporter